MEYTVHRVVDLRLRHTRDAAQSLFDHRHIHLTRLGTHHRRAFIQHLATHGSVIDEVHALGTVHAHLQVADRCAVGRAFDEAERQHNADDRRDHADQA